MPLWPCGWFFEHRPSQTTENGSPVCFENRAAKALQALRDPKTGLYRVSRDIPHSLFMDNLEIWSTQPTAALARAIQTAFWDEALQVYRVTTQTAHPHPMAVFTQTPLRRCTRCC